MSGRLSQNALWRNGAIDRSLIMLASIIIPTHRRHRPVLNLLSSLENQDFPKNEFEILIISNLPDPSLRKQIEKQIGGRLL